MLKKSRERKKEEKEIGNEWKEIKQKKLHNKTKAKESTLMSYTTNACLSLCKLGNLKGTYIQI